MSAILKVRDNNGQIIEIPALRGPKGPEGVGIESIEKTSTEGLVDTYTITLSDGSTSTFTVTNGEDGEAVTNDNLSALLNFVTPQMYGAVGDGETDDTQAIQAMFDSVAGADKVYFPYGNYLTTAPITVETVPDIEMDGVIMSNHAGVALDLGTNTSTIIDKTIKVKIKKKGTKHEAGSIGLLLHSSARNTFYLDTVNNFETNVKLLSVDKGIWFNTFHLNNLNYAKYGLYLDGSNNGWINDNLFIGGSISVDSDNTAITINHGSSNVFLKQGLEGAGTCVHIIYGSLNSFMQSRCERAIRGLVIDDGKENIMQSNYAKPEFVNNSRYTTNGIIRPGVHGVCQHPSVSVGRLEDDKFLKCGDRVVPTYCQMINATSGTVLEDLPSDSFFFENGSWRVVNYRPVFVYDTTQNKKFEFGGHRPSIQVNLFDVNGRVIPAEEDISLYVKADKITLPQISDLFGGGIKLLATYGFEVSEEIIRVELVFLGSDYDNDINDVTPVTNIDIRTEYPCYPIRDEIITVPYLPTTGFTGAKVIFNNSVYVYNGTMWESISGLPKIELFNSEVDEIVQGGYTRDTEYISDHATYASLPPLDVSSLNKITIKVKSYTPFDTENPKRSLYKAFLDSDFKTIPDTRGNFGLYGIVDELGTLTSATLSDLNSINSNENYAFGMTNSLEIPDGAKYVSFFNLKKGDIIDVEVFSDDVKDFKKIRLSEFKNPTKVSELENDSNFITDDKVPEIAEQAAVLIDSALLAVLGDGVIE